MFNFFLKKKKNIDTNKVKDFNSVLKTIKSLIYFEDFERASRAIDEVIEKENKSFDTYINNVEEKRKRKEVERFKRKLDKLHKLKRINEEKKKKFELNMKNKKRDEEIEFVKKKITELIGKSEFEKSIGLLNSLLASYPNDSKVISFVVKQKKIINKNIELNKKRKEKEIRKDTFLQAQELIGNIKNELFKKEKIRKKTFFDKIRDSIFFYSKLKRKLEDKKLLDEVNLLLQIESEENEVLARTKLAQVHSGISKEISGEKINGYELYGKILGAGKISGDCLGFSSSREGYTFFIGDATGHGAKAGLIVSQLTRKFNEIVGKLEFKELVLEINNSLKQNLKSGNFITSTFFNINKNDISKVSFVGMGHEPMFLYRKRTGTVEKIVSGGLAAGIRIIRDVSLIKRREIEMDDGDILIVYTDGIVEARNLNGEMYGIDRIGMKLKDYAKNEKTSLQDIYKKIIEDLKNFTGGKTNYLDDVSILLLKRDKNKEIIEKDDLINEIIKNEGLDRKYRKNIRGKNLDEIKEEILKIKKENALKNIIKHLDTLHKTGEIPKLKQECIRYIREGYIHKKINKYLKESIDNENLFRIKQKEQKIRDKYNLLKELYKKGDYETVIIECLNVISKDGSL